MGLEGNVDRKDDFQSRSILWFLLTYLQNDSSPDGLIIKNVLFKEVILRLSGDIIQKLLCFMDSWDTQGYGY